MSPTNYQYTQMKPMNEKNEQTKEQITDWLMEERKEGMYAYPRGNDFRSRQCRVWDKLSPR